MAAEAASYDAKDDVKQDTDRVRALGVSRAEMLKPRANSCCRLIERGPRGDLKGQADYPYPYR